MNPWAKKFPPIAECSDERVQSIIDHARLKPAIEWTPREKFALAERGRDHGDSRAEANRVLVPGDAVVVAAELRQATIPAEQDLRGAFSEQPR